MGTSENRQSGELAAHALLNGWNSPAHGTLGGEHPDHPPVEGGYTGFTAQNPGATGTAQNPTGVIHTPAGERASVDAPAPSVLAEAVLADAVRRAPALPTDSAERKRTPLCAGLLDYAPAALTELADAITRSERLADDLVAALRDRDWASVCVLALCDLDAELKAGGDLEAVMSLSDLFTEFAASLAAVAQVSWYGNEKHNPGQPLHHARGKSTDHADCILRHHVERGGFDGPMRHSACKLWRGLIAWQEDLEAAGAPKARGAK